MAAMKPAAVALLATVLMAVVATCVATDIYVHFEDKNNVDVFGPLGSEPGLLPGFGDGQVFDYDCTLNLGYTKLVARAQGLFYASSNHKAISSFQETFTILFLDPKTYKYTGTSYTFLGVFVSGTTHNFPIVGGTGALAGLKGTATLVPTSSDIVYKIVVTEVGGKKFKKFFFSLY